MFFKKKNADPPTRADLLKAQIDSERSELRWRRARRAFVIVMVLWSLAGVAVNSSKSEWAGDKKTHAPVIRLEGGIAGDSSKINAETVIQKLANAFDDNKAPAVILYIDSPGGSPAEAERINHFITFKKKETGKPLYSVCANMCASAGYMIAMQADEIYASKYSLVGSIGAVLSSWNFAEAINKLGVQHNAYASGKLKAMLNPYAPVRSDDQEKAQHLVNGMGRIFAAEVQERRAGKLSTDVDLFTGEVWAGSEAHKLGLVDTIGTLDELVRAKFPVDTVVVDLSKPSRGLLFLRSASDMVVQSLSSAIISANVLYAN